MYIILSNAVVGISEKDAIYVPESGCVKIEREQTALLLVNVPDNALQLIAEGVADGKRFIEMDAELALGEEEE